MTSIQYNEIYSRLYGKVNAYDFLDMTEIQRNEFLCNWIHSTYAKPHIRKIFSSIKLDDEIQELGFEMNYPLDDDYDKEFVTDVFAYGVMIEWLSPKIYNITNMAQMFTGNETKFYNQANHLAELENIRNNAVKEQTNIISNRGYSWNTYLDGTK